MTNQVHMISPALLPGTFAGDLIIRRASVADAASVPELFSTAYRNSSHLQIVVSEDSLGLRSGESRLPNQPAGLLKFGLDGGYVQPTCSRDLSRDFARRGAASAIMLILLFALVAHGQQPTKQKEPGDSFGVEAAVLSATPSAGIASTTVRDTTIGQVSPARWSAGATPTGQSSPVRPGSGGAAITPGPAGLNFTADPTDDEFLRTGLFVQPLIPIGPTTREENRDLSRALRAYASGARDGHLDTVQPILDFMDKHPNSAWKSVLQLELGAIYRRTGHFSKALDVWQACWNNSKTLTSPNGRTVGDMAVAYLSQFEAYLGRKEALAPLLQEVRTRPIRGTAAELVSNSSSGLADMTTMPEWAFKCGPSALARILAAQTSRPSAQSRAVLDRARSTPNGLSLSAVRAISVEAGMNYQMAFRSEGAPAIVPAVVHWKVGHFAALLGKGLDASYWVADPTFGEDIVISPSALNEEASGYFLVPPGRLPNGWRSVDASEGDSVWGRGDTGYNHDVGATGWQEIHAFGCGSGGGCSTWNVEAMVDGLSLHDNPVGYIPPVGPAVRFQMDYSHRDALQPMQFGYTNFGNKWTAGWLSYITKGTCELSYGSQGMAVGPNGAPAQVTVLPVNYECDTLYRRGGGSEQYTFDVTQVPHLGQKGLSEVASFFGQISQAVLIKLLDPKANNALVGYWRMLPDGSIEKFELLYGNNGINTTFFMTEVDDAQGNAVAITWDKQFRIVALTDALGQVTTVCYNDSWQTSNLCAQPPAATNPPTNLQVTQVRDPFGRSAYFGYDPRPLTAEGGGTGHLTSITDVLGITSTFIYAKSDFILSLTTPYGVTQFAFTDSTNDNTVGSARSVTIADPLNRTSRVEFRQGDPDGNCTGAGASGDAATVESHFITCTERATPSGMPLQILNHYLQFRNTFIWDPHQYQAAFGNSASPSAVYSSAKLIHWLHTNDTNRLTASRIPESTKLPLEHRTWLQYENQAVNQFEDSQYYQYQGGPISVGSSNKPTAKGTLLDDGRTQLWTFKYNSYGKVTQMNDPIGRQVTLAYDANGIDLLTVTNTTTVNGTPLRDLLVTYANYNSQHEPQKVVATNGFATTFSYNAAGQLLTSTDPLGNIWRYAYTNGGYIQQITGPPGPQVPQYNFVYDLVGRIYQSTDPSGGTLTYSHDQADRLTRVTFPDQTSEAFSYTLLDLTSTIDRKNNTIVRHYDADREVTEIDEPSGRTSMLTYAMNGTVQTMQDPGGFTTTWTRDLEGRATAVKYADSTSVSYTHDGNNRITAIERIPVGPLVPGVMVQYTYNPDDTLSEIAPAPAGRGEVAAQVDVLPTFFRYDPAYRRLTGWVQASEQPTGNNNPTINSYEQISYNPANSGPGANRVSIARQAIADSTGQSKDLILTRTAYVYDQLDRVTARNVTPNDIRPFHPAYAEFRAYDALGRVVSNNNMLDSFAYAYSDATPRVTSRVSGGMSIGLSYYGPKGDELLQEMAYVTPIGLPFADHKYKYDSNRNVTQFDEFTLTGGPSSIAYTYDPYNQLLNASPGGQNENRYTYDANGNLTSQSLFASGLLFSRTETTYDKANAIVAASTQPLFGQTTTSTADYDVSANLTAIDGINYKYDRLNRLVEARQGNNMSDFFYDGIGRLVQVVDTTGGKTVRNRSYGWCNGARCVEYDNTNQVPIQTPIGVEMAPSPDRLYYGQGVVDSPSNGSGDGFYYIADALGNVRGLSHSSAANPYADPTVTQYTYGPYGGRTKVLSGPDADFGFAGYFHHEATGLEFTSNRVYNPQLQRWLTRDPLGAGIAFAGGARSGRRMRKLFGGGDFSRNRRLSGPGFNATDLNLYAYALNNPTTLRDPSGLSPGWIAKIVTMYMRWVADEFESVKTAEELTRETETIETTVGGSGPTPNPWDYTEEELAQMAEELREIDEGWDWILEFGDLLKDIFPPVITNGNEQLFGCPKGS